MDFYIEIQKEFAFASVWLSLKTLETIRLRRPTIETIPAKSNFAENAAVQSIICNVSNVYKLKYVQMTITDLKVRYTESIFEEFQDDGPGRIRNEHIKF